MVDRADARPGRGRLPAGTGVDHRRRGGVPDEIVIIIQVVEGQTSAGMGERGRDGVVLRGERGQGPLGQSSVEADRTKRGSDGAGPWSTVVEGQVADIDARPGAVLPGWSRRRAGEAGGAAGGGR